MNQEPTENDLFKVHPYHQPEWSEWRAMHHAPISHLVFLSINICPLTALDQSRHGEIPGWEILQDIYRYPEYYSRLAAVLSHVKGNSEWFHPVQVDQESPSETTIRFDEFAKFARAHDWLLPKSFPCQPVDTCLDVNHTHRWPWGDYTTERLEIFQRAVHQFWSDYDPSDPDAAPTNAEVETFLENEGIKEPSVRQAMSALMRHETAPNGRRKKSG